MSVVVKTCSKFQRLYLPHFVHDYNVLDTSLIPSTSQSSDRVRTAIKPQHIRPKTTEIDGDTVRNEALYSSIIGAVLKHPALPKTPPPPPTTTPSVTNTFCTYLIETKKDLPNNLKIQLEEDILALVFAAKKKHRSKD
ncbi:unnamed protein product [Macrosiphum euphorbiae]|uniref:Uncharacterized protein n=1 Tax=Macrosiphum euphorbiae TaxID=13131 RepID=A0AAV0XXL5_9HEMI|nr:unnamed protein product [Macrosiphum euphorbiae]